MAKDVANKPSFLFILGDDIGWADFGYNNGTAHTPNIDKWVKSKGTILMQDFHSGGTVCSPTRATVLTGRNHFRDCVNYVYGCSDMTECVPNFEFAPQRTFTIGDAARAAGPEYASWFSGKWHLGSFYNDSELHGGRTSSPITHGFDHFNATVEVAPTATTNCQCRLDWNQTCLFGHYHKPNHCSGGPNPGGGGLPNGCCFNYWWEDSTKEHGVTNLTNQVGLDDSLYLADAFTRFLESRKGSPFLAQISFHNCHIPYIGTPAARAACAANKTCKPNLPGTKPYSDSELDFYSCISELDHAVGLVLNALEKEGYTENTMVWMTTDNGPEVNCAPEGFCKGTEHRPEQAPGSAGPLRGRKRDIYEGGHRVPGIVAYPAVVKDNRVSWDTVITMDFLPTVMEILGVKRPASQSKWNFDGKSIMPILRGESWPERGLGWMYSDPAATVGKGYGFRYGPWKFVRGSISCKNDDCKQPQLFNLDHDLGERHDLAKTYPEILSAIQANFTAWHQSILYSRQNESFCGHRPPTPAPPPSSKCTWHNDTGLDGGDFLKLSVVSKEECCGACRTHSTCKAADYNSMTGNANMACHLKTDYSPKSRKGSIACVPT